MHLGPKQQMYWVDIYDLHLKQVFLWQIYWVDIYDMHLKQVFLWTNLMYQDIPL